MPGKHGRGNPDLLQQPAQIFLRLRPRISLARAEREVRRLYPALVEADLRTSNKLHSSADLSQQKRSRAVLVSARNGISTLRQQFLSAVPVLAAGVGSLLLLVTANIGGLMLVKSESRRHDIALRLSLGASRLLIFRE